jgi:DNA repair exonuclease SbcCD nuclease subunit
MKTLIYSDPHVGLSRVANTTPASAQKLRDASHAHVKHLLTDVKQEGMLAFCLGDLLDQYSNPEAVIEQAMELVKHTDIVLAGNHDISNRKDKVSSLELLHKVYGDKILIGAYGEPSVFQFTLENTLFVFIPHVANQELFETALQEAQALAAASTSPWKVLCIHCNYNLTFDSVQDTSLNLTSTAADLLLADFHFIFSGHEHVPVDHHNGRVRIVGNPYPTSFSDISDKLVLIYDSETGEVTSQHTLSGERMLWKGRLSEMPENVEAKFLDLEDDLPRGDGFKAVTKLYKSSDVFAIRLRAPQAEEEDKTVAKIETMESLPEVVRKDLQENRPGLLSLWEELLAEVAR